MPDVEMTTVDVLVKRVVKGSYERPKSFVKQDARQVWSEIVGGIEKVYEQSVRQYHTDLRNAFAAEKTPQEKAATIAARLKKDPAALAALLEELGVK